MNNRTTKMKNSLDGTNNRLEDAEEQMNGVENILVEITDMEENKEKNNFSVLYADPFAFFFIFHI